ncbi:hypothetical protein CC78DRAFT_572929 [Lojkania enalia]|uniref:Uncharacterized protein n=1 Tax=Lojkania enalia TaxID=147567 RepID=A0A9P4JZE4_9PLEO|nr:hypothetical protein CC78DRAFT_572929 [Didymosphaeria enalia]
MGAPAYNMPDLPDSSRLSAASLPPFVTETESFQSLPPSRRSSTIQTSNPPSLLPDVLKARNDRMNEELVSMFHSRPDPLNPQTSFTGNGTYTHIDVQARPRFPHEEYLPPSGPRREFLPLGRGKDREGLKLKGKLNEEVKKIYEELKEALEEETKTDTSAYDPIVRFGGLPVPDLTTTTGRKDHRDVEARRMEGVTENTGNPANEAWGGERRVSYGGPRVPPWTAQRRPLVSGRDIVTSGAETVGSTYDASRDPRRRGK